jgi:transposase
MENAGPYDMSRLVDIDETLSTAKEFLEKYGYAPVGDIAERVQFIINGEAYSAIVAYSAMGVLCYRVVQGSINSDIFKSFIENEVANNITPNMVGLFDNAKIHHTQDVRDTIHLIFRGNYLFAAPYSPDLKPVERLFSVVKTMLREIEDLAVVDPVRYISECLDQFAPGGPKCGIAENHFRLYRDNHNAWMARL